MDQDCKIVSEDEEMMHAIIADLSCSEAEIDPKTYDPSYEMAQKAATLYGKNFPCETDQRDLDLFYYLVVSAKAETRRKKIEESSLKDDLKAELLLALAAVERKKEVGNYYEHESPQGYYGMFRRAIGTFNKQNSVSKDGAKRIVKLFADVAIATSDDEKILLVEKAFAKPIKGFQNGVASQILHCLDPYVFPIINSHEGRDSLYSLFEIGIPKNSSMRNDLTRYAEYCKKIRAFRDASSNHFAFKNYRVFDLEEAKLPQIRRKTTPKKPSESATKDQLTFALYEMSADEEFLSGINEEISSPNIFEILHATRNEIRHSYLLAWLLDPIQTHGLGDAMLREFLRIVQEKASDEKRVALAHVLETKLDDVYVQREKAHIDILATSEKSQFALLVENKTFTSEHDDQLLRYLEYAKDAFPNKEIICIYLTPFGDASSDPDNWQAMSYKDLVNAVDAVRKRKAEEIDGDVSVILKHFSSNIKTNLLGEGDLREMCRSFYKRHRLALDAVFKYVYDPVEVVCDIIQEWLEERSDRIGVDDREGNNISFFVLNSEQSSIYEVQVGESKTCVFKKEVRTVSDNTKTICEVETAVLYNDETEVELFLHGVLSLVLKECSQDKK